MGYRRFVKIWFSVLLIGGIAGIVLVELFVRSVLIPNDMVAIKEKLLAKHRKQIRILALGDSHVLNGLTSEEGSGIFNFAKGSDTIPLYYFKLKQAMNVAPVEVLLLQFDPHIFSTYRKHAGSLPKLYTHIIDEDVEPELGYYPKQQKESSSFLSMTENYGPFVFKSLGKYLQGKLKPPRVKENGFTGEKGDWSRYDTHVQHDKALKRIQTQVRAGTMIEPLILKWYEKVISHARKKGLRVVLISYPLSRAYLEILDTGEKRAFEELKEKLVHRYGVDYWDYRSVFVSHDHYFANSDHLNESGAEAFSELLEKKLLSTHGKQQ